MPDLNLSFTITSIIAICALVSPIATALINNHHQKQIKRLELEYQQKEKIAAHEQDIYEGYVRAAGACIHSKTVESLKNFGEHSSLVAYYVPEEIRRKIIELEKAIRGEDKIAKIELLSSITLDLRSLRNKQ